MNRTIRFYQKMIWKQHRFSSKIYHDPPSDTVPLNSQIVQGSNQITIRLEENHIRPKTNQIRPEEDQIQPKTNQIRPEKDQIQHKKQQSSIDPKEIERFKRVAQEWYNPTGEYSLLHRMNPERIRFIKRIYPQDPLPLKGLKVLDIGCGGGFLTEALARLGAQVLGADATLENIQVAQSHLPKKLKPFVEYRHCAAGRNP